MFRSIQYRYTFYPERAEAGDLTRFNQQEEFLTGPDGVIHLRYSLRPDAQKFILFSHGNSSSIESLAPTYAFYEELGVSYLAYDYPGYGKSGGKPTEEGLYRSFALAYTFVTETLAIPPEQLYLHGLSLGGAVTIQALPSVSVAGAILESTFTSAKAMARVLFPALPWMSFFATGFDSLSIIKNANCELLFIHGEDDPTIPAEHSSQLAAAAQTPNYTYIIPNCGHADQKEQGGATYRTIWKQFLSGGVAAIR